jgi:hypothetical protein
MFNRRLTYSSKNLLYLNKDRSTLVRPRKRKKGSFFLGAGRLRTPMKYILSMRFMSFPSLFFALFALFSLFED